MIPAAATPSPRRLTGRPTAWHRLLALGVVAAALVACGAPQATPAATGSSTPGASAPASGATPGASPVQSPNGSPNGSPLDPGPSGFTETARVVRVVDGDTIVIDRGRGDERLRYIGMDTPETVKPGSAVEWMGREAAAANRALVEGRMVVLETDVSDVDRYDRLLRHVWLHDGEVWLLVDEELVRAGYARVSTYPPDVKYVDRYLAAQVDAREHDRGLWGTGPLTFLEPVDGTTVTTAKVVVRGTAPAGSRVVRDIANAPDQSTRVATDGTWSLDVTLKRGVNTLRFRVEDEKDTTRALVVTYAP